MAAYGAMTKAHGRDVLTCGLILEMVMIIPLTRPILKTYTQRIQ